MARQMKDSGVEWIGEIPEEWSLCKLRNHVVEIKEKNAPIKTTRVLSLTNKLGVVPYEDKGNQGNKAKEKFDDYHIAYEGTIVANSMNILIGSVGLSQYYGCVSPVYYVYRNVETSDIAYINYIFQNEGFQKELRKYANGIMEIRLRVSSFDILGRVVPNPPLAVQKLIANALNTKCAEIDKVVEQTRATIEEYKKLKQAIITEAVTKGVRGPRPMKPSGVEWIGDIPEEWTRVKLKSLISHIESGVSVNAGASPAGEGEIGVLKTSCVSFGRFNPDENKSVNKEEIARVSCPVQQGCLIVSRMNTPELVGACGYVQEERMNIYLPDRLWQVHISPVYSSKYIYYYLSSKITRSYYASIAVGTSSSMQNISQEDFCCMYCTCPSYEEQQEMAAYLDTKCAEIDRIIEKKEQLIEELGSYKKSLIYECVTGKREIKIHNYSQIDIC